MAKKTIKVPKLSNNKIVNAVLYIAIGVLMCIFRAGLLNWLLTGIGIALIVFGIIRVLDKKLIEGIVMAAVGVVIILGGWLFLEIALLILGIALLIKGVLDLFKALKGKQKASIITSIITAVVGGLLIASKWLLFDWLFIVLGVILILNGILALIGKK